MFDTIKVFRKLTNTKINKKGTMLSIVLRKLFFFPLYDYDGFDRDDCRA